MTFPRDVLFLYYHITTVSMRLCYIKMLNLVKSFSINIITVFQIIYFYTLFTMNLCSAHILTA